MPGFIIYRGPSLIDNSPIVAIAITGKSKNSKTGNMMQTYILADNEIDPITNNRTGADYSICGDCVHRGTANSNSKGLATGRTCYVDLGKGVTQVWKAYVRGSYPEIENCAGIAKDRMVRIGTYGDPAAVPAAVWRTLLIGSKGHTGYTHQHKTLVADYDFLMASVDSADQAIDFNSRKIRTFRVIPISVFKTMQDDVILKNEILCPASEEAGRKVQCENCKLCAGSSKNGKSIAIVAHGPTAGKFQ